MCKDWRLLWHGQVSYGMALLPSTMPVSYSQYYNAVKKNEMDRACSILREAKNVLKNLFWYLNIRNIFDRDPIRPDFPGTVLVLQGSVPVSHKFSSGCQMSQVFPSNKNENISDNAYKSFWQYVWTFWISHGGNPAWPGSWVKGMYMVGW
jgi:hypothetical protein